MEDGEPRTVILPMVNVVLTHKGMEIKTPALIDSGATTTFVPDEIADLLGLDKSEKSGAIGAGGDFETWLCEIDKISIMKNENVFVDLYHNVVNVPLKQDAIPYMILGRDTVFSKNDITFFENRKKIKFVSNGNY